MSVSVVETIQPNLHFTLLGPPRTCAIRFDPLGTGDEIIFAHSEDKVVMATILREMLSFRAEIDADVTSSFDSLLSPLFQDWYALVLGEVYSDRVGFARYRSKSDMNRSFALRVVIAHSMTKHLPKQTIWAPHNLQSKQRWIHLCLPPLWQKKEYRNKSIERDLHLCSNSNALFLLRPLPFGSWAGRILRGDECSDFYPLIPSAPLC